MANTWQAVSTAVAFAASKGMLDVMNAVATTRFIRVYRAYGFNNGTAAVTGVLNTHRISLNTAASAGTTITPIAHATANSALNANTTAGSGRTLGTLTILRQLLTSNDEPVVSTLDWDAMGCLVPYAEFWNAGYGDSNVEPIVLASGQARGLVIFSLTQTVGSGDYEICFTDAAA